MKQQKISFKLVAYTDAAGKYSPDAFRSGNEDNFYVSDDLANSSAHNVSQDEIIQLGNLGVLMVVADGMGGMNAGEVASQIAVDTIKDAFTIDKLSESVTATVQSRQKYLEQVIKLADKNIKSESRQDRAKEGMGSTIIIAWIVDDDLSISWCGDSRAYLFNEKSGIRLISQDHSYVQELVNKGMLTYEQTFDHPQNNIITRSLGDPTKDAKPESKNLKIGKGDIILLCSDGLSVVLRDRKTYDQTGKLYPEENLEDIIRAHTVSMKECREALWAAAERGGWYDNVTAILCQIVQGPESRWANAPMVQQPSIVKRKKKIVFGIVICILFLAAIAIAFCIGRNTITISDSTNNASDSIAVVTHDSIHVNDSIKRIDSIEKIAPKSEDVKKTIKEQVKEQNEKSDSTFTKSQGLTPIRRDGEVQTTKDKLTPIQNKSNGNSPDNPLNSNLKSKNNNDNIKNE